MTVKLLVASYLSRWLAPSTSDTERESRWLNEACPGADRGSVALTCGMLGTRVSSLSL